MPRVTLLVLFSLPISFCQAIELPQLSLSPTALNPLPGQVIDIVATGGDMVSGISLGLQIGTTNGIADEPVFTGLDFSPGPLDDVPHVEGNPGPVASAPNLIEGFIFAASPADQFALDGVVAQVTIDASGFEPGQEFPLLWEWLTNLPGAANSSVVIDDQEVAISPDTVVLTVVPEPSSGLLAALATVALLARGRPLRIKC